MSTFDPLWRAATKQPARNRPHGNLMMLRVAVLVLFAVLAAQLFRMQIVDGEEYARRSVENHITETTILPPRGLIYDRNGEALVANMPVYSATLVPEFLDPLDDEERYQVYLALEDLLGIPALEIQQRVKTAEDDGTPYIALTVKDSLSREEALALEEAAVYLPGVTLTVKPGRNYVGGPEFSHLLGYIGDLTAEEYAELRDEGYALNEQVGKSGIEAAYEDDLRGTRGTIAAEQNAFGRLIAALDETAPVPGNSVRLSVDAEFQRYVTELLEDSLAGSDPRLGDAATAGAVVMNAGTGEIYGLVSLPTYDNNIFSDLTDREAEYTALVNDEVHRPLLNKVLTPSAPGSTFKLVTAAAGLETGRLEPSTGFDVTTTHLEIIGENGEIYYLIDWAQHGYVDLRRAIAVSSNQYFFMTSCGILGESRGLAKDSETSAVVLGYYARSFGFGAPTGIDIGGEDSSGIIPDPAWKKRVLPDEDWYYYDTCGMGIGQGDVLATPMQVARMTAAVANGGLLVTPHVAGEIIDADGNVVREIETKTTEVPVSDTNLQIIREGMHQSVQSGAGMNAGQYGVDIWGKTGTAEFYKPDGTLSEHAWFTGFVPYGDTQIVITVYFDVGMGGAKAAPVAGQIMSYFMENVEP